MSSRLKSKIVFKTTDEYWNKLREAHRKKYPGDINNMNLALQRAVEEFVK